MKITKQALKRIITEEIKSALKEGPIGDDEWKQWQRDITGVRGARLAGEKVSAHQRDKHRNVKSPHHDDRARDTARSISDIFTGEEKVYALSRQRPRHHGDERVIVGVYSSKELAQAGIESDIASISTLRSTSKKAFYQMHTPGPEEYQIEDFNLDDTNSETPI